MIRTINKYRIYKLRVEIEKVIQGGQNQRNNIIESLQRRLPLLLISLFHYFQYFKHSAHITLFVSPSISLPYSLLSLPLPLYTYISHSLSFSLSLFPYFIKYHTLHSPHFSLFVTLSLSLFLSSISLSSISLSSLTLKKHGFISGFMRCTSNLGNFPNHQGTDK